MWASYTTELIPSPLMIALMIGSKTAAKAKFTNSTISSMKSMTNTTEFGFTFFCRNGFQLTPLHGVLQNSSCVPCDAKHSQNLVQLQTTQSYVSLIYQFIVNITKSKILLERKLGPCPDISKHSWDVAESEVLWCRLNFLPVFNPCADVLDSESKTWKTKD